MSELQEGLSIILESMKKDERWILQRTEAAVDVMSALPYYEHMTILKAIFHAPMPEESGESDGA